MEPIDFLGAPRRRWPVIIPFVLVAAIVAVLIPVSAGGSYPANTWQATAQVGLPPGFDKNTLGAHLGLQQLIYYAHAPVVLQTASKASGVPLVGFRSDVIVSKNKAGTKGGKATKGGKKGGGGKAAGVLYVSVLEPTKPESVKMTNAFVEALGSYAQLQLDNQFNQSKVQLQQQIASLEAALTHLPKKPPTTTTTTPHAKHAHAHAKKAKTPPTTTTTTHAHALGPAPAPATLAADVVGAGGSSSIVLTAAAADPSGGTAPTLATLPNGEPAPQPAATTTTAAGSVTTAPGSPAAPAPGAATTTTTTLPPKAIDAERTVLAAELGHALADLNKLANTPAPASGYTVFVPALGAVKLNPNPPLLAHHWIRLLLGLLIGLILGVVATWLLDAFDRRFRSSSRAEEVFGLPVLVEIPASDSPTVGVIPVVDTVAEPYSAASEAYRKLHVAILTAPAVTWVRRGASDATESQPALQPQALVPSAPEEPGTAPTAADDTAVHNLAPVDAPLSPDDPTAPVRLPVAVKKSELTLPRRERFSILVTSPRDEATRSLVVVNLAAVFAEAGDRVLVVTTGGLRTEFEENGNVPKHWDGDLDSSELVANARPSQIPGVSSLALGQILSSPSMLTAKAKDLVTAARDVVDVLLLEAPLLSTQDAAALMPMVDLVVVVCEAWETKIADGVRTQRLLAQRRPSVLGMVMTNMAHVD